MSCKRNIGNVISHYDHVLCIGGQILTFIACRPRNQLQVADSMVVVLLEGKENELRPIAERECLPEIFTIRFS